MDKATFAAGCFWGVQAAFDRMDGVIRSQVGYTGGHVARPNYEQVCSDTTGHAEAVEVEFDPEVRSYERLVRSFFEMHDPTTLNKQGPDEGSQYRSAIFYHNDNQKRVAEAVKDELDSTGHFKNPIVTEILPVSDFWRAEEYHQKFLSRRGMPVACH